MIKQEMNPLILKCCYYILSVLLIDYKNKVFFLKNIKYNINIIPLLENKPHIFVIAKRNKVPMKQSSFFMLHRLLRRFAARNNDLKNETYFL